LLNCYDVSESVALQKIFVPLNVSEDEIYTNTYYDMQEQNDDRNRKIKKKRIKEEEKKHTNITYKR
jgi:hypothetical protein